MIWVGRYVFDNRWETYYLKSNNGGDTWTQSINLSTIDDRGSYDPVIAINSNGIIAACWIDSKYSPNPWNGDLFLRFSYDGGENWSVEKQITYSHWAIYPNIAWSSDTLHVVWEDDQIGSGDIFYIMGINGGQNWDSAQIIDSNLNRSSTPDISVSGPHRHIVWGDWRIDPGHGVYYTRWDLGSGINGDLYNSIPFKIDITSYPNPFNNSTFIECSNFKG